MKAKLITKADIILAIVLLILGIGSPFVLQKNTDDKSVLVVSVENEVLGKLSLKDDGTYYLSKNGLSKEEIDNPLNVIVVENKKAYVSHANCEGKDCIKMGKISKEGEVIACLPHKLLLSIESSDEEIDVVLK